MLQIKQSNVVLSKRGITYVPHTHSYNEGGEGATTLRIVVIDDPKESSMNPFADWAGKDILLILSVFTEEPTFQLVLM